MKRPPLGQHFLIDFGLIDQIITRFAARPGDRVVEIGPGRGALTEPLIEAGARLIAIERDAALAAALRRRYAPAQLEVRTADALTVDWRELAARAGSPLRIIGNLPYQISTPLLFNLIAARESLADMLFMLQREVANRLLAEPGSAARGRLSVRLRREFACEKVLEAPPAAFAPPPKVYSSVLSLRPRPDLIAVGDERLFTSLITQAFAARRKTLKNALGGRLQPADFAACNCPPEARAQELSVAQFACLSRRLAACGGRVKGKV